MPSVAIGRPAARAAGDFGLPKIRVRMTRHESSASSRMIGPEYSAGTPPCSCFTTEWDASPAASVPIGLVCAARATAAAKPAVEVPALPAPRLPVRGVPALGLPALGAPALGAPALGVPALDAAEG